MFYTHFFMEIKRYELSKEFNRNQAIYILHMIDGQSVEQIAEMFNLATEEIKNILELHKKYEAAVVKRYS